MRPAATAIAVAFLAAVVCLGPEGATSLSAASGTAGDCAWTKHSKRVVKHVRRHGRKHRVVTFRHWWTCDAPVIAPPPVTDPPPVPDPPAPSRLGVESKTRSYILSRPNVAAGDFIVQLNNTDGDPHNFNIAPADTSGAKAGEPIETIEAVAPGQQGSLRFDIPPGNYYLYCSLLTHEAEGMHAELVVDP